MEGVYETTVTIAAPFDTCFVSEIGSGVVGVYCIVLEETSKEARGAVNPEDARLLLDNAGKLAAEVAACVKDTASTGVDFPEDLGEPVFGHWWVWRRPFESGQVSVGINARVPQPAKNGEDRKRLSLKVFVNPR